jgi:hypothetical protein
LDGELQIASFHPQYQFSGTEIDVITNFTASADKINTVTEANYTALNGTLVGALVAGNNYGLRGDFNTITGVFTANTLGADTLVFADADGTAVSANLQDSAIVLIGVTTLTTANFV